METPSAHETIETSQVQVHCIAEKLQLQATINNQAAEITALKNTIDDKDRQLTHLEETLAKMQ